MSKVYIWIKNQKVLHKLPQIRRKTSIKKQINSNFSKYYIKKEKNKNHFKIWENKCFILNKYLLCCTFLTDHFLRDIFGSRRSLLFLAFWTHERAPPARLRSRYARNEIKKLLSLLFVILWKENFTLSSRPNWALKSPEIIRKL